MALRDLVKRSVRTVLDRFSGEYSAGQTEIRPDDPQAASVDTRTDVKVTRARLKRPPGEPA